MWSISTVWRVFHSSSPRNDEQSTSPCNIGTLFSKLVTRKKDLISFRVSYWYNTRFTEMRLWWVLCIGCSSSRFGVLYVTTVDWQMIQGYLRHLSFYSTPSCLIVLVRKKVCSSWNSEFWALYEYNEGIWDTFRRYLNPPSIPSSCTFLNLSEIFFS